MALYSPRSAVNITLNLLFSKTKWLPADLPKFPTTKYPKWKWKNEFSVLQLWNYTNTIIRLRRIIANYLLLNWYKLLSTTPLTRTLGESGYLPIVHLTFNKALQQLFQQQYSPLGLRRTTPELYSFSTWPQIQQQFYHYVAGFLYTFSRHSRTFLELLFILHYIIIASFGTSIYSIASFGGMFQTVP